MDILNEKINKKTMYVAELCMRNFRLEGVGKLISEEEFMKHAAYKEKSEAERYRDEVFYMDLISGEYKVAERWGLWTNVVSLEQVISLLGSWQRDVGEIKSKYDTALERLKKYV